MTFTDTSHREIIRGFSEPTEADLLEAEAGTLREREWHAEIPGFGTTQAILDAAAAGQVARVEETLRYRPVTRFMNPELESTYPPFLPFAAHALLEVVSERWRDHANRLGVPSNVRLAVTSMSRSEAYQRELVAGGKLAVGDSSHTKIAGGAVDIDLGGYYQGFGPKLRAVSLRSPAKQKPIEKLFVGELGAKPITVAKAGPKEFDPRVPQALLLATEELHEDGLMNRLEEFAGTSNNCLHMAAHPDFLSLI